MEVTLKRFTMLRPVAPSRYTTLYVVRLSFLPHRRVEQVFAKERLARHFAYLHHPVSPEHDDVVDVRAIAQQFSFGALQARAHKPLCWIPAEFGVGDGDFAVDGLKRAQFCSALLSPYLSLSFLNQSMAYAVKCSAAKRPFRCRGSQRDPLVGLAVKFGNAFDSDFSEARHILVRHLAQEVLDAASPS